MEKKLKENRDRLTTMKNSSIESPSGRRTGICEFCNKKLEEPSLFREFRLQSGTDQRYFSKCGCQESEEKQKIYDDFYAEMRETERNIEYLDGAIEALKKRQEKIFQNSNVGKRFKTRTFENFEQNANEVAYNKAFAFADSFDENDGDGLLFIGSCGTGKTHLAASIANHVMEQFAKTVKFGAFVDLLADIKSTFDKDSKISEDDIIKALYDVDLLIIDDVGKERNTEWSNSILYRLINSRYENYKSTIITTNLSIGELENEIGKATVSRIIEMCDGVKMDGADFRKNKLL